MVGDTVVIRLRLSRDKVKEFLSLTGRLRVSSGIARVLEEYSEVIEEDVLEQFLRERR